MVPFVQLAGTTDVPMDNDKKTAGLLNYRTLGGPTVNSPALLGDKALMLFGEIATALTQFGANRVPQETADIWLLF
jgi:hypothetical protein